MLLAIICMNGPELCPASTLSDLYQRDPYKRSETDTLCHYFIQSRRLMKGINLSPSIEILIRVPVLWGWISVLPAHPPTLSSSIFSFSPLGEMFDYMYSQYFIEMMEVAYNTWSWKTPPPLHHSASVLISVGVWTMCRPCRLLESYEGAVTRVHGKPCWKSWHLSQRQDGASLFAIGYHAAIPWTFQ